MLDREVQSTPLTGARREPRIPRPITLQQARDLLQPIHTTRRGEPALIVPEIVSAVGHADTARIIGGLLGIDLPVNRISIKLSGYLLDAPESAEMALIGQYVGPRLPEGATELPEGATIEWWQV